MDTQPSTPAASAGRKHVGQAVFLADGRAKAVLFDGRRYDLLPDGGPEAAHKVGEAARLANLYIDQQTFELYDHLGNRLAATRPRE